MPKANLRKDKKAIQRRRCQYPLWGNDRPPISEIDNHFCGKPVKEGSSYCEEHHALCHEKPDPEKPHVQWNWTGRKRK